MHWVLWICEELGREACSLDGRVGEIGEEELLVTEFDPLLKREGGEGILREERRGRIEASPERVLWKQRKKGRMS